MIDEQIVLKATNITKSFVRPIPLTVLENLSLEVRGKEAIAITGRSGEGKTTLLHILGTLESPTKGSLEINGVLVEKYSTASVRNKHFGFIFQSHNLLEDYTVIENLLMPLKIAGERTGKKSLARFKAMQLLDMVGLKSRFDFPVKKLSGGEKQRVCIARALINDPNVILADEPSGNLDYENSRIVQDLLIESCKRFSKALIIATHDEELANLCDSRYLLKNKNLHKL